MKLQKLILASRSPRRAQLLRDAGYAFTQADPPFADPPQPERGGDAVATTLDLAMRKAVSVRDAGLAEPSTLIIGSDTTCVGPEDELVGQPSDRAEAERILRSFLGRSHRVVSAVALLDADGVVAVSFADEAVVNMGRISDDELQLYLDTEQWRGKAGAYNLFDRQAAGWPIEVVGDPTTVVGLPMKRLQLELNKLQVHPTLRPESTTGILQA